MKTMQTITITADNGAAVAMYVCDRCGQLCKEVFTYGKAWYGTTCIKRVTGHEVDYFVRNGNKIDIEATKVRETTRKENVERIVADRKAIHEEGIKIVKSNRSFFEALGDALDYTARNYGSDFASDMFMKCFDITTKSNCYGYDQKKEYVCNQSKNVLDIFAHKHCKGLRLRKNSRKYVDEYNRFFDIVDEQINSIT